MTCEVRNKKINSQCAELLVRPFYMQYQSNEMLNNLHVVL